MNVIDVNEALRKGSLDLAGLFPRLERLQEQRFRFRVDFGLERLPEEPGILMIRGARQVGKSTWLEGQLKGAVERHGPGSAYALNGDELASSSDLVEAARHVLALYSRDASVRRLFIDEITAVDDWQTALKLLADRGELKDVLVVTTGSSAVDLHRGAERLPGRKGKLDRTSYLFTPISYTEFRSVCRDTLGERTLNAYILAGGSPLACAELAEHGRLPEYMIEMTRDWILGEFARAGRSRASLFNILECIIAHGGTPLSQAKLAREAALANNTVAVGYLDLLVDLLAIGYVRPWDVSRRRAIPRKPGKIPFTNLLVATAWHAGLRRPEDLLEAAADTRGRMHEWAVAQELWRRRAIAGEATPESLLYWHSKEHELDFVVAPDRFLEVKSGEVSPRAFTWFPRSFPKGRLTVINQERFATDQIEGITLEDFLLDETS